MDEGRKMIQVKESTWRAAKLMSEYYGMPMYELIEKLVKFKGKKLLTEEPLNKELYQQALKALEEMP